MCKARLVTASLRNMPRNKKTSFDTRDALEILRDVFLGRDVPKIAELGTHPITAHAVAEKNPYLERIEDSDLARFNEQKSAGKKRLVNKELEKTFGSPGGKKQKPTIQRSETGSSIEETGEFAKTFWEESAEPEEETQTETIVDQTEKALAMEGTPPSLPDEPEDVTQTKELKLAELANKAARTEVSGKGSIEERLAKIAQQRTKLTPEEQAKFDTVYEKAKKQLQGVETAKKEEQAARQEFAKDMTEAYPKKLPKETPPTDATDQTNQLLHEKLSAQEKTPHTLVATEITEEQPSHKESTEQQKEPLKDIGAGRERYAQMLFDKISSDPNKRKNIKAQIAREVQTLLDDKPDASQEYKKFVNEIGERAVEIATITVTRETTEPKPSATPENPPVPPTSIEPTSKTPEEIARVEQYKRHLAEREADFYENDVAKMEERIDVLIHGKSDVDAIDRLQQAIQIAKARGATPQPPKPLPSSETQPTPPETEQEKESLAQREAEYYGYDVAKIEKQIKELSEEKLPDSKGYAIVIERLERALEIAKAREVITPEPPPAPVVTPTMPPVPDLGVPTAPEPTPIVKAEAAPTPEPIPPNPEHARYDARIAELDKRISKTGGTPEERREHFALQHAQKFGYDASKIESEIAELKKQPAGLVAMKMQMLTEALGILKPETLAAPEPTPATPKPAETPDKDALLKKLKLGEYAPKTPEATPLPPTPEAVAETTPASTDKAFEEFGISAKELRELDPESFAKLSTGQKRLLFHNLNQVVLGRIQTEAAAAFRDARKEDSQQTSFMGRVAHGFLRVLNPKKWEAYKAAEIQKKTADEIRHDTANHKIILAAMMQEFANHGPEAIELPDGTLDVRYMRVEDIASFASTLSQKEQQKIFKIVDNFNANAHTLENTPVGWGRREASRKEKNAFKKAHAGYERTERSLLLAIARYGKPEEIARQAQHIADARAVVRMNQMMSSHPEAAKELQRITSEETWWRAAKNLFRQTTTKERSAVFVGGFLARSATMGLFGYAGAALGGYVSGKLSSRALKIEAQKEELALARGGYVQKKSEFAKADKLQNGFANLQKKLENAKTEPERRKILSHMDRLLLYAEQKSDAGELAFQKGSEGIVEKMSLGLLMGRVKAEVAHEEFNRMPSSEYKTRVQELLLGHQKAYKKQEQKEANKDLFKFIDKNAFISAGMALGGAAAFHFLVGGPGFLDKNRGGGSKNLLGLEDAPTPKAPENLPIGPETSRPTTGGGNAATALETTNPAGSAAETPATKGGLDAALESESLEVAKLRKEAWSAVFPDPDKPPPKGGPDVEGFVPGKPNAVPSAEGLGKPGAGDASVRMESSTDYTPDTINETPVPTETAPVPISHAIGNRGSEGAIIDEFRNNPELAKQFGWDGEKKLDTWAKSEADKLYKVFQKEALANPSVVENMEQFGYQPTPKGHESMMHRIKSGAVELDPATKSITLKDVNIIKASETITLLSEAENVTRKMTGLPLDKYADVRETTLAEYLKKPPRGKGFQVLAEVIHQAKPSKAQMGQSINEFLTARFGK